MLGIGANRPDGPEAIAWKQNKDFEGVLERLNKAQTDDGPDATLQDAAEEVSEPEGVEGGDAERRKRKEEKRQRKEAKKRLKEEKKKRKEADAAETTSSTSASTSQPADKAKFRLA